MRSLTGRSAPNRFRPTMLAWFRRDSARVTVVRRHARLIRIARTSNSATAECARKARASCLSTISGQAVCSARVRASSRAVFVRLCGSWRKPRAHDQRKFLTRTSELANLILGLSRGPLGFARFACVSTCSSRKNRRAYFILTAMPRENLIAFVVLEQATARCGGDIKSSADPAAKTAIFKPAQTI